MQYNKATGKIKMQNTMKKELLECIGANAQTMDEVVEIVEGFKGSNFQDQAIAAQAFLKAKKLKEVNPVEAKMAKMGNAEIYDVLIGLKGRVGDAENMVFEIGLDILMERLPEEKLIAVLAELEA